MKFFVLGESLKEYAPLSDAIAWHEVSFSLAADGESAGSTPVKLTGYALCGKAVCWVCILW